MKFFPDISFWMGKFFLFLSEQAGFVERTMLGATTEKFVWSVRRVVEYAMQVPQSFSSENMKTVLETVLREAGIEFIRLKEYGVELVTGHPDDGSSFRPEILFEGDGSITLHVPFGNEGLLQEDFWDNLISKLSERYWGSP